VNSPSSDAPAADAPIIHVAAGLVFHQGRLLITQRRHEDHLGGYWEFPGGKIEPGETFEACLARELLEELGIQVRVGALLEDLTHPYPGKTVRLRFYRCALLSGEARPLGCAQLAWITPGQLRDYPFPAADAQLLGRLGKELTLWQSAKPAE